jgi:hypothetical protein
MYHVTGNRGVHDTLFLPGCLGGVHVKTRILTAIERRRLEDWLKGGMEDRNLQKDLVKVRRNLANLRRDIQLLSEVYMSFSERYELVKSGQLLFNHPEGTHDDRFGAWI